MPCCRSQAIAWTKKVSGSTRHTGSHFDYISTDTIAIARTNSDSSSNSTLEHTSMTLHAKLKHFLARTVHHVKMPSEKYRPFRSMPACFSGNAPSRSSTQCHMRRSASNFTDQFAVTQYMCVGALLKGHEGFRIPGTSWLAKWQKHYKLRVNVTVTR